MTLLDASARDTWKQVGACRDAPGANFYPETEHEARVAKRLGAERPARHSGLAHPQPLDVQLARAALGWSNRSKADLDQVADQLLILAGGNRTALERALRRFQQWPLPAVASGGQTETTGGRASAALRLALTRGSWAW